jgi:hypothetical protein
MSAGDRNSGRRVDRVVPIDPDLLEFALRLTPEDRVRQAICAWRIYLELHHPYAVPRLQGFDTYEECARADEAGAER